MGILAAMMAGFVISGIMAVGHIKYKADICAIGMGINLFALAITKFMLNVIFDTSGTFTDPDVKAIPRVDIPFIKNIPILKDIFNDWAVTEWFMIVLILILTFLLYRTRWGLRLRAVGQFPMAAANSWNKCYFHEISGDSYFRFGRRPGRSSFVTGI